MALASHAPNLHMTCDLPGVAGLGNAIPMAAYIAPMNIIRKSGLCLVTMFMSVWPNNSFTWRAPVTPNYGRSMGRAAAQLVLDRFGYFLTICRRNDSSKPYEICKKLEISL